MNYYISTKIFHCCRMGTDPLLVSTALWTLLFFATHVTALKLEAGWPTVSRNEFGAYVLEETQTGLAAYRILNQIGGDVYVGSNETLLKLSISDSNTVVDTKAPLTTMEPPNITLTCSTRDTPFGEALCWNYIRVVERTSSGGLLVCGTNAYSRQCYECNENLNCTTLSATSLEIVPRDYSTDAATLSFNRGGIDVLYGGRLHEIDHSFQLYYVDLMDPYDPIQFRQDSVIKEPTYVGKPFQYGNEYVFLFYRESALEYTSGNKEYSRIARVCQNDAGGTVNKDKFVTFIKARLECSVPGDPAPFYYDDIQDAVWDSSKNEAYAIFTSQANGPASSALCRYRMEDIMLLFDEGNFKEQQGNDVNMQWQPVNIENPRPGTCTGNRTIHYPPLLDRLVSNYNPAEHTGEFQDTTPSNLPRSDPPILYVDGVRFTTMAVDFDNDCVYFFGTTTGTIIKASKTNCSNPDEPFQIVEINELGCDGAINGLEFLSNNSIKYLVVTKDNCIIVWPLNTECATAELPAECASRFPYCQMDARECTCTADGYLDNTTTATPSRESRLRVVPGNTITACYDTSVFWYCYFDRSPLVKEFSVTWRTGDGQVIENGDLYRKTRFRSEPDNMYELEVLVRNVSNGTEMYQCRVDIDGFVLTTQVELIKQECLTENKILERCEEYQQLQAQNEALKRCDIGVEGNTCAVAEQECP